MDEPSTDAFSRVYSGVRRRIAIAAYPPGLHLKVDTIAKAAGGISATPVREALSRLAGEGLIESWRRQGYRVPVPTASVIVELLQVSQLYLVAAIDEAEQIGRPPEGVDLASWSLESSDDEDPQERSTRLLLLSLLHLSSNSMLWSAGTAVVDRLSLVRRLEPRVLTAHASNEALGAAFAAMDFTGMRRAVGEFHDVRRGNATAFERAVRLVTRPQ